MVTLVIAEKPSVGREIARVLGARTKHEGYQEGNGYLITWAIGHLAELCDPEEYHPEWKSWKPEHLPMLPEEFKIKPAASTRDQLRTIQSLLKRPDVTRIVNACDAGREGELIFQYIMDLASTSTRNRPVYRLWVSSMTDQAIRDGFARLRPATELAGLAQAARARAQADWVVGMNATRAYTLAHRSAGTGMLLTLGRVQTPTLAILARREAELAAFKPTPYWLVEATFESEVERKTYSGRWFKDEQVRLNTAEAAEQIAAKVRGKPGRVVSVEERIDSEPAPLLYDLTALQRDANRRYRYPAAKTLQIAQTLYEEKKLITYPRTSSRYLSRDMIATLPDRLRHLSTEKAYEPYAAHILSLPKLPISGRIVNDAKVTDHHAIIPTESNPRLERLTAEERNIFDLVARRFMAIFYPPAKTRRTVVITEVAAEMFRSRGATPLEPGWKIVYGEERPQSVNTEEDEPERALPQLKEGERVVAQKAEALRRETQPPKRYTEATLLSTMETAGKLVEDDELKQALKDSGLGTPATRAAIIERLIKTGYIERQGTALVATPKGMELVRLVNDPTLVTPELTGQWEHKLAQIERGEYTANTFMDEVSTFTRQIVDAALSTQGTANFEPVNAEPLGKCPLCGGDVIATFKGYGCSRYKKADGGCSFAIWPICGKKLTPRQVQLLLRTQYLPEVKGFRSPRTKKLFTAGLKLEADGKISFVFDQPGAGTQRRKTRAKSSETAGETATPRTRTRRKSLQAASAENQDQVIPEQPQSELEYSWLAALRCPQCGGQIIEGKRGYGCSNWRSDPPCKFVIWKERGGVVLAPEHIQALLTKRRTPLIRGFTAKSGKLFNASLILNDDGTVSYDFADSRT